MIKEREQWKPIPGFPDYEVSNMGLVRSYKRTNRAPNIPHILKPGTDGGGYQTVLLRQNGKTHGFRIGRLVLLTFRGPCPEDQEMCHSDGDPANDHLDNLRWDTHAANMRDLSRHHALSAKPTKAVEVIKQEQPKSPVSLGKQIKVMRIARGINQGELARLIEKRQPTLSEFETDKLLPSKKTLQTIKAVLSWPPDDQAEIAFAILMNDGSES